MKHYLPTSLAKIKIRINIFLLNVFNVVLNDLDVDGFSILIIVCTKKQLLYTNTNAHY